jgi:hypothetical protein
VSIAGAASCVVSSIPVPQNSTSDAPSCASSVSSPELAVRMSSPEPPVIVSLPDAPER